SRVQGTSDNDPAVVEAPGTDVADSPGAPVHQNNPAQAAHRQTALAHVMPAPKPESSTRSPSLTRPASTASTSAIGIDAELVLPVRWMLTAVFSIVSPSRPRAASMMRTLAWCGTYRVMSSAVALARSIAASAESTITRTAR